MGNRHFISSLNFGFFKFERRSVPRSGVPGVLPRTTLSILECRCSPIMRPRNTHWGFFYPLTTNASYYNDAENIDTFFMNFIPNHNS